MTFKNEAEFETNVIDALKRKGWGELEVLKYPTEEDLIKNWAQILYNNNRSSSRLGDYPLTDGEMGQILAQIKELKTPLKLNEFINGTIMITRDNSEDKEHYGKTISLKLYDRQEIAAGQSRYQIAEQPMFKSLKNILPDRRGDLMLLINGMPVIHIELKNSGIPVSRAYNQIEVYSREGIFTGIFSLIQIFVAMTPDETVYFANPGPNAKFNKDFYFHWANSNNDPMNNWADVVENLLSIPMAHQLIGFYTIADKNDKILKVMRSYQFYAARAISDRVAKEKDWDGRNRLGGYVWHTTGSGKTMTSFKSAQLIATSKDADKVVFLVDRIELATQSVNAYKSFSTDKMSIQSTEDTKALVSLLKSKNPADTLIVTSIQKMSNITDEAQGLKAHDLEIMKSKRIVFIIDECHRSTFGEMLGKIKETFPCALYFGFTGTPILDENKKKLNKTSDVFGDELHRYSIADGIRDKNVLGFDKYMVTTFKDSDLREQIALIKSKSKTVDEAVSDEKRAQIFYKYMDPAQVPMAGKKLPNGKYIKGIEDDVPVSQYQTETHQKLVVEDIKSNWKIKSRNNKFHAIFATSSIPEAIDYYRLLKQEMPMLNITCLFDPNISLEDGDFKEYKGEKIATFKEKGLEEIITDYNNKFFNSQVYTISEHAYFKKDIAARLAHKEPYVGIENNPKQQLNLVIVVDQLLTGFDSKWINTLYMDKLQKYENIIQTFSRTNRIFNHYEKPYGTIRYYRYPHTMTGNIDEAIKLYSGDKPYQLFVPKLGKNIETLNEIYEGIKELFKNAGFENFEQNPEDQTVCAKFAKTFKMFNETLEAAKVQGFSWKKKEYCSDDKKSKIRPVFDEQDYLILVKRYKELFNSSKGGTQAEDVPFEIDGYITEINTGRIDNDYMNSRFDKFRKNLEQPNISKEELQQNLDELHKSFAVLTSEEQKYANIFLQDVQTGNITLEPNKSFRDYVTEYQRNAKDKQKQDISNALGVDINKLIELISAHPNENNINEFGRFDKLMETVNQSKAKEYFEKKENKKLKPFQVSIKTDKLLRKFVLTGGFDVD